MVKINKLPINLTSVEDPSPIANVPCGSCNFCCRILSPHLTREEISSGKYPMSFVNGPDGDPVVVLYRKPEGGCALLIDGKCSIYEDRPKACRQFDCRLGHHPSTNAKALEIFGYEGMQNATRENSSLHDPEE